MMNQYPRRADQQCGNCFYGVTLDPDITEGRPVAECHRHAPAALTKIQASYDTYWPEVLCLDWCGEWAPLEADA